MTLILVVAFIGLCVWVFLPKKKREFEEDAKLPFDEEPTSSHSDSKTDLPKREIEDE